MITPVGVESMGWGVLGEQPLRLPTGVGLADVISPYAWLFGLSAVVLAGLAAFVYPRRDEAVGGRWLWLLLVGDAAWATVSLGRELSASTFWLSAMGGVQLTVSILTPVVWLAFALAYTGREQWLSNRTLVAIGALPAVTPVVYLTNPLHGLAIESMTPVMTATGRRLTYQLGEFLLVVFGYGYLLTIAGTVLIGVAAVTTRQLYLDQTVAVFLGALAPVVGSVVRLFPGFLGAGVDLTPAFLSLRGVAFAYALFAGGLLESTPAVARVGEREALDALSEAVVIIDATGTVVTVNTTAAALAATDRAVGRRLSAVFPGIGDMPALGRREWSPPESNRVYELAVEPIRAEDGVAIGRVCSLRDMTGQRRRRERVEVMNRVLRHNLRNDMNVVSGKAELAVNRLDDDTAVETLDAIRETAEGLVRLGEKVRRFEQAVSVDEATEPTSIDAERLLTAVADRTREQYPDARVSVTVSGSTEIVADAEVFESVLTELADNAVRHNDRDEPLVRLVYDDASPDRLVVTVIDDGPGIPPADRAAVERGAETQLRHASRLGLWLVRWGVTRLNGSLSFAEREPRGTRVRIELPKTDWSQTDPAGTGRETTPSWGETAVGRGDSTESDGSTTHSPEDAVRRPGETTDGTR